LALISRNIQTTSVNQVVFAMLSLRHYSPFLLRQPHHASSSSLCPLRQSRPRRIQVPDKHRDGHATSTPRDDNMVCSSQTELPMEGLCATGMLRPRPARAAAGARALPMSHPRTVRDMVFTRVTSPTRYVTRCSPASHPPRGT
jgi:hypothetical protein